MEFSTGIRHKDVQVVGNAVIIAESIAQKMLRI